MEAILAGQSAQDVRDMWGIVIYTVLALTALLILHAWAEQPRFDPNIYDTDAGDEQPEPPEPTTPSHGTAQQPDIEPDEVQGLPYVAALPLWASDKQVRQRASVIMFRQRTLANMSSISTRRVA